MLWEKVMESLQELEPVFSSLYNGVTIVDHQGIVRLFNQAASKILNLELNQVIDKPYKDIFPELEKDLIYVLHTGQKTVNQKSKIGKTTIIANRTPIYYNSQICGAVAVFQDISDLEFVGQELEAVKELNLELDAIINNSYDGIWVTDGQGKTLRVNKNYIKFSGIPANEVIGRDVQELVNEGYYSDSATVHVLQKKEPVTVMHDIRTGKRAMVTAVPVFNAEGDIWRVVANVRDITELLNLKEKLEEATQHSRRYQEELEQLKLSSSSYEGMVVCSLNMKKVLIAAIRVSKVNSIVLILGESGVGKGVVAEIIHRAGNRKNGPFIKINCGAIPENLIESELFGYEKGAFTGSIKEGKCGLMELANCGTLFLDEIGELPLLLQVKLLQVIQDQQFFRVGGRELVKMNVRIIAASNADIKRMVAEGKFREDLYYRLNVVPIVIPPLRERKDDIAMITAHFLKAFNQKNGFNKRISSEVVNCLINYNWPGNVRELENLIERLIVMSEGERITVQDLPPQLQHFSMTGIESRVGMVETLPLKQAVEQFEMRLLSEALEQHKSFRKAAKYLEVDHSTLVRKAQKYGLTN